MNTIVKTALKEICRVLISALAVYFGLTTTGCVASGDGAVACFTTHN